MIFCISQLWCEYGEEEAGKEEQTNKTVKDFGSIVILTCMAVLFASSVVQPAFSCFTFGFSRTVSVYWTSPPDPVLDDVIKMMMIVVQMMMMIMMWMIMRMLMMMMRVMIMMKTMMM